MIKATALYGHPKDENVFETYYHRTHLPLARKITGLEKIELTKFFPNPDGSPAAYYRMAELYFPGLAELQQALSSPEGQTVTADFANFATGGVTIIIGNVEN